MDNFKIMLQAFLDKVKSIANIKTDIKNIEPKLPKIKITGTLNTTETRKELNAKIKSIKPKVKVDADTTAATKRIKELGQQKTNPKVTPTVDNTQVISGLKETQKETKTLFERFINGAIGVNLVRMSVQKVISAIHEAIAAFKELDKIKTNIQMVSRTSASEVNAMMSSYNSMAKDLSSTTKSISEAANEFLRMGEGVSNTNELIKSAQVLSTVGMLNSSDAASYLISSLKGYQIAAEDSMNIVDKLSATDAKAAVSAAGLAEALSKCANIAQNSGVTIDRLIGYTATIGEVTQKSMSEVGNSVSSLLSRMNNIKIGRFVDDETGESLSDTETVLNKLGIKLRETEDMYRNFDDVLDDIGKNWLNFTQIEQNAISVAIAGTRQRENFVALMNNYSSALEYAGVAADSAGSALKRYEAYQDSLEAKTNELTAAIESLSMNTLSEEMFSGIVTATTNLVEFIDKTNLLKGTLAGLVTMGVSKMLVSMATGFVSASKSAAQLTSVMAMFNMGRSADNLKDIGIACKGLSEQQLRLVLSTKDLEHEERLMILTGMGVAESEQQQTLATLGFASAEDKATASTFSLSGALNSLIAAWNMNPIGMSISALTTVITVATMAFSYFKQSQEELLQSTKESANAYKESASSIEDYTKRYSELQEALLAAKDNEEETYNVKKQLLDLQTELNDKFGEEYGAINLVTDAYKDQTEAIKSLNKEAAQTFLNENQEGIKQATAKMTEDAHYNLSYTGIVSESDEGKALKEIAEKYKAQGISTLEELNGLEFSIHLNADPQSAYETINAFESDVRDKARELGNEHLFDDILEISSSSLNDAKDTIDKYGDIYKQALTADIVTNNDDKAKVYNEALETVKAYNEAILQSEDIYNDKSVEELRQSVQALHDEISNDEAWEKYGFLMDDIFDQADTRLLDFNEALKNDDGLQKLADDLKGLSDLDLKALDENVGDNVSFDKLKESAKSYNISVEELIDALVRLGVVQKNIAEENSEKQLFSSFDGIDIGERLQYITSQFEEGKMSHKEYFDALQSEINNLDFSNYTASIEEVNAASQQFFTDSIQQTANGLSDLINKFDSGQMSISEYLDGYLSIASVLNSLTDNLQENSAAWDQNGKAMSDATNGVLDNTQANLESTIETIKSYQDSIYSIEQLMTGSIEAGTDEFSAHIQVIAEDLANIVATGGQMADEISRTMGTTTAEIAQNLTDNVSNQGIAAQAIAANTNTAIADMANSVGELFDTLGAAISNFKVDLTFGVSNFNLKDVALGILGVQELPEITFSLQASGDSLSAIGSAISSFGKSVSSNLAPQMIEMPDFNFTGDNKYTPDASVLDNYNKKLGALKDAQKGAKSATDDANKALKEQKEILEEQKDAAKDAIQAEIDGIDDLIAAKQKQIDAIKDEIDKIKEASEARKLDIKLQNAQYDLARAENQRTKLVNHMPDIIVI